MKERRRDYLDNRAQPDPWLEKLTWLMERSVPLGKRWSIGLDGLLGLIPGFGDLTGGIISTLIIARSLQAGLPRSAILRMIANVATDSVLGSIPFVGDVFDFAFKANSKNLEIYREAIQGQRRAAKDWLFVVLVFLVLVVIVALPIVALLYLAQWLR